MSIVSSYASEAAEAALKRQRVAATVSSIFISLLVVVLLALVLMLIMIRGFFFESPTIVTYSSEQEAEEEIVKPEMTPQVQRQPSAPSSSMARVIASTTPTTTSVPVPEVNVPDPSIEFGDGNDFGDGWGSGSGFGSGGGGTTFFGQTSRAERVCYVIDYSASMKGEREQLMRKELAESVEQLPEGLKYQLIFFAGPGWVAGDDVNSNQKVAIIKGADGEFQWKCKGGAHNWDQVGKKQVPQWMDVSKSGIRKSKKIIEEHKLVWGTYWRPPLEMALSMDPPPQVIYFMTDGSAGNTSKDTARTIGAKAKSRGIIINCVAMMEPKAHDSMKDLAKRTGGQFTVIFKGGKRQKIIGGDDDK